MKVLEIFFYAVYSLNMLLLFYYGIHTYFMVYWCRKYRKNTEFIAAPIRRHPAVTVQIPIYNERYVVERVITAAAAMDYPKDLLEIQVLDDSTDDTLEISRDLVNKYRGDGFNIVLLHREKRTGHKGGALREGLVSAAGEFVAVFDADFVPSPNFLRATIPLFQEDPRLGMVQTRWGHLNSDYSLLTRAQAIGIDGHFIIDQIARGGSGKLFMNFNGTAGIWRKECIIDAGNWQDDTLTEDFDLSYRAMLRGWRFSFMKDVVSPQELPVQVSAYKSQQFRWAKGSIQTALKLAGRIILSKEPFLVKLEAITHLTYYSVHPLMILNIFCTVPFIYLFPHLSKYTVPFYIGGPIFTLATIGPIFFYSYSQFFLYSDWWKRILFVPMMMVFGAGIAVNNTRAFLEAIIGRKSEFVRTPKLGIRGKGDVWKYKKYRSPVSAVSIFEAAMGTIALFGIVIAIESRNLFAIPFLAIYSVSFYYIFILEMIQTFPQQRSSPGKITFSEG